MIFLLFLVLFSSVTASSDVDVYSEMLGKRLYEDLNRVRGELRRMFVDPLTVHDCTGRSVEIPLDQQMEVVGYLTRAIPNSYTADGKLFHRVMIDGIIYIFEAEYEATGQYRSYRIQRLRKQCPAMKIAGELNELFMNIKNFTGILTDPYYIGDCGYKTFPYTHKSLRDDNKFDFRSGMNSTIQKAEFVTENEIRYETKMEPLSFWKYGSAAKYEFTAVRNAADGVFLIRKEWKMC